MISDVMQGEICSKYLRPNCETFALIDLNTKYKMLMKHAWHLGMNMNKQYVSIQNIDVQKAEIQVYTVIIHNM